MDAESGSNNLESGVELNSKISGDTLCEQALIFTLALVLIFYQALNDRIFELMFATER